MLHYSFMLHELRYHESIRHVPYFVHISELVSIFKRALPRSLCDWYLCQIDVKRIISTSSGASAVLVETLESLLLDSRSKSSIPLGLLYDAKFVVVVVGDCNIVLLQLHLLRRC